MKKTFDIRIIKERKINSTGSDIIAIGFFSTISILIIGIPYYPYPFEDVPLEINLIIIFSVFLMILGAVIKQWRKHKPAKLTLTLKGIEISGEENLEIPFNHIKEISDLRPGLKFPSKHLRLVTKNKCIDIKAGKDLLKYLNPLVE